MFEISVFAFDQVAVRLVMRDGEPWFVAADVCTALELPNTTRALERLDGDEQALISIQGISRGNDQVNVINEPGLYALILGSRKSEAKRFKRWVTHEVLPTIRKTGRFEDPSFAAAAPRALQPADRIASAARIFNALVRSGNVARVSLPAAIRRAAAVAERETGVDMLAELHIAAHIEGMELLALNGQSWNGAEPTSPAYVGVVRFWESWVDGGLGLPFQSCTSAQAYTAYTTWCRLAGISHTLRREHFSGALQQCSCRRGRPATVKVMRLGTGEEAVAARMLLVTEPPDEAQGVWAGELSKGFAAHLKVFMSSAVL